jgi:membrane dipeptidase
VVGLTTYPPLNWKGGRHLPAQDDYLDNIEYVIDLVGIDHVAIGTDSEATPGAYPREVRKRLRVKLAHTLRGYYEAFSSNPQASHLDGLRGTGDLRLVTQGLLSGGYDKASIQKILGLNLVRVFREVWQG